MEQPTVVDVEVRRKMSSKMSSKYGARLAALDRDGDGKVDRSELLEFLEEVVAKERRMRNMKIALISLVAVLVLFALTTFGCVWAVVALTQKINTQGGTALVDAGTGTTLHTSPGVVALAPAGYDPAGAALAYGNTTAPGVRRLLAAGATDLAYIRDVDEKDVLAGCRLLLDGTKDFVALPSGEVDDQVSESTTTDDDPFFSVKVNSNSVSIRACKLAVRTNSAVGLVADIDVDGSRVHLDCSAEQSKCRAFAPVGAANPSTGAGRRRLAGAADPQLQGATVSLKFGHMTSVCTQEGCAAPRELDATRRRLLFGEGNVDLTDASGNKVSCGCSGKILFCSNRCDSSYTNCQCDETGIGGPSIYRGCYCQPPAPSCFSPNALVTLASGTPARMADLAIGDEVMALDARGALAPSTVYAMPHAQTHGLFAFKRIATELDATVTVTPDHYLHVSDPRFPGSWAHRMAVPAGLVALGDVVWVHHPVAPGGLKLARVVSVVNVVEQGVFAPFTLAGTIVADGVVASVYNSIMGSEAAMHSFCSLGRWLWRRAPVVLRRSRGWPMNSAWAAPLAVAVGRACAAALAPPAAAAGVAVSLAAATALLAVAAGRSGYSRI
jgi:hypothetical protein